MLKIGVTEHGRPGSKVGMYEDWIRGIEPAAEFVRLNPVADNVDAVDDVDALLLTGGADIHPKFYGRDELLSRCEDVDLSRDQFELRVVGRVLEQAKPILAICRGHQLLNVALGGSLLTDVESSGFTRHRGKVDGDDMRHPLHVHPHSMLYFAVGGTETEVNSSHHQSVDRLGTGLTPSGFSPDGVIEALEWSSKEGMPFLLSVQWHPERMVAHPVSHNIASLFLRDAQRVHYRNTVHHN